MENDQGWDSHMQAQGLSVYFINNAYFPCTFSECTELLGALI